MVCTINYRKGEKPLHEYLRSHAVDQPDKPAFIWYGRTITYDELNRLSDAFAAKLASLGVVKGDRVALFMQNCPQYIIAHFGIQKLGAIVSPCSPLFKVHELKTQISDLEAKIIVAADNLYQVVQEVREQTSLQHVFLTNYTDFLSSSHAIPVPDEMCSPKLRTNDTFDLLDSLASVTDCPPNPILSMDDVALMTYTSGTTGMPKGAMLTYKNALFKTSAVADCNILDADDVLLDVAPLYHIAGMLIGINVTIYTGATSVLLYRFDPVSVLQAIDLYRVTYWYSIATMNVAVMKVPGTEKFDLTSLRENPVSSFGITFTQPLAEEWLQFTGRCKSFECAYGLSETHTWDSYMPRDSVKWGTNGVLAPGVECRIVDVSTNKETALEETGEILLRSPGVFKGYWNKPEATAEALQDGWLRTGDIGKLDSDGYLTFCGRIKEMIKVSGYSVFPEEVETILIKHPAIKQAAVIGISDSVKGQVVKAVVVLKPEAIEATSVADIISWSRENMSAYKVPREIEFRDSLPATGAGKILRRLLSAVVPT